MGEALPRSAVAALALLLLAAGCTGDAAEPVREVEARLHPTGPASTDACGVLTEQQVSELADEPLRVQQGFTVTAGSDRYVLEGCTYESEIEFGALTVHLSMFDLADPEPSREDLRGELLSYGRELAAHGAGWEEETGQRVSWGVLHDHPLARLTGNTLAVDDLVGRWVYVLDSPVPFLVLVGGHGLVDPEGEPTPAADALLGRVAEAVLRG